MSKSTFDLLREEFPKSKVQQRKGPGGKMLDYIAIETFLNRLLDVAPEFHLVAQKTTLEYTSDNKFLAWAQVNLVIDKKVASGVGAMVHADPDMALKSALSEATKNAAKNGWGMSLYLWDEEKREEVQTFRQAQTGDIKALRKELLALAREQGKPVSNRKELATAFSLDDAALDNEVVLTDLLKQHDRL